MKLPRPSKYRAKPTVVDGIRFASKREATRYVQLKCLEQAGAIDTLRLQISYCIGIKGRYICTYVADFTYTENGRIIVEDCKGFRTREYKLKKRLMKVVNGIDIKET